MTGPDALLRRLRRAVGDGVLTDPELIATYTTDWTGRFRGHAGRGAADVHRRGGRGGAGLPRGRRGPGTPGGQHRPGRRRRAAPRRGRPRASAPAHRLGRSTRVPARSPPGPGPPWRPSSGGRRGRLGVRGGPGQPRVGHRGRHGGHQRRGHPGPPPRRHPCPAARRRGRARDRRGRLPPRRAGQGQHRLPPARPAVRQRGDAGGGHRRPPPPGAPGSHRTVALLAFGDVAGRPGRVGGPPTVAADLEACELFLRSGLELVCAVDRRPAAVHRDATRLPPGRGGRPDGPHRRRWPRPPGPWRGCSTCWWPPTPPPGRPLALPGGPHRGHQHPRTAAQARRDAAGGEPRRVRGSGPRHRR